MSPLLDAEHCYSVVRSRDARFDGCFVTAVTSTGIYCRPSCPAVTPKQSNVRFYATSATAQQAGFRACLRCRPDAAPGSPEWNLRADLVGRAMRLIGDGVVERDGVPGLARRLGYSERHVHRQLVAELGAGPLALARAQRTQTARVLIETTTMPFTDVAFAAGFASVRQFNDSVREIFAATPGALRTGRAARRGAGTASATPGAVELRLPYRAPFDAAGVLAFLAAHMVAGLEEIVDGTYRRTLRLAHGAGVAELTPVDGHVRCRLRLDDLRDLGSAVQRCRRLLDLDADPVAVDGLLGTDPLLADLVAAVPGRRVPGSVDGAETALRAVLGQQVSVAAACTATARIVAGHGTPLAEPDGGLTHLFPTPAVLAEVDPATLRLPASRQRCLLGLAGALAAGTVDLEPGADRAATRDVLLALPGIGPWTAGYVALRALADPDALLHGDLVVRRALARRGASDDPRAWEGLAERWRPWRAYAVLHLWAAETDPRVLHLRPESSRSS